MRIYAFRSGKKAVSRTDTANASEIVEYCKHFADRWLEQSEWFFEDLPQGATAFVETRLIVPPHNPNGRKPKITHALSHREKHEPNTLFIGVFSDEEYLREKLAASASWLNRQADIRRQADAMRSSVTEIVRWENLPADLRARCHGSDLLPDECWLWKPVQHLRRNYAEDRRYPAPYRELYVRIKGQIPDGVVLRHKCDNRRCWNPNHLEPGTPKDNVQDMMARARHAAQWAAVARIASHAKNQKKNQRSAELDLIWTPDTLERAQALSREGHSAKEIAAILGAGITSRSIGMRLYYLKLKSKKAAKRRTYLRRKEMKLLASKVGPNLAPKRDDTS